MAAVNITDNTGAGLAAKPHRERRPSHTAAGYPAAALIGHAIYNHLQPSTTIYNNARRISASIWLK